MMTLPPIAPDADTASVNATGCLAQWLAYPTVHNIMVAAGNSPLELYRRIGERGMDLTHLRIFALDEYVGVPPGEPRNCANVLRRAVADAWGIPPSQFHAISPLEDEALASVQAQEQRIAAAGGIDVVILGLGQNGHLGFNEPGSAVDSVGRLVPLDAMSIDANRKWFDGDYAPATGVTVGMKTILAARRVLLMAFGSHKAAAVKALLEGPPDPQCPASFLRYSPCVHVFLDRAAAANLRITA